MQKGDIGIPFCTCICAKAEGMVFREPEVIRSSFIHESERAGRKSVPGVRWNNVQSGLQLCLDLWDIDHEPPSILSDPWADHGRQPAASHPLAFTDRESYPVYLSRKQAIRRFLEAPVISITVKVTVFDRP